MPDELCEVVEMCNGTSLISSTIVNRGVHHLCELRSIKVVVVFDLLPMLHLEGAFIFTTRQRPSFQTQKMKERPRSPVETLRITDVGQCRNICTVA